jgi:hypothetical protein
LLKIGAISGFGIFPFSSPPLSMRINHA